MSGVPIRDLSTSDLLSQLAIILQDGGLLTDTVAENIRLGKPGATDAEIVEAAKSARIHDRIMELSDGYDSVIGTEGACFSGGEAQRIALARAFLADSRVLLLDEATAQADPLAFWASSRAHWTRERRGPDRRETSPMDSGRM